MRSIPMIPATLCLLCACADPGEDPSRPAEGGAAAPPSGALVDGTPDPAPPTARHELAEGFQLDREAERHPSDGGGRAWLEDPEIARVGVPGSWTVIYEVGPLGIAEGGAIHFLVPPFWNWSGPQARAPELAGFTRVSTRAEGVELEAYQADRTLLLIAVGGRALEEGETVRIEYGAGASGAAPDRYAERESPFWIGVDGDGDGIRALVPDPPQIDVQPGPPAQLHLFLPSTAQPGESVPLTLAVLDPIGNAGAGFEGELELASANPGLSVPETVVFTEEDRGFKRIEVRVLEPGIHRVAARTPDELFQREPLQLSNPLLVTDAPDRILWADLHGHSNLSDGTGTPEDYYRYARDFAALDVVALTDHDHWGVRFVDENPDMWERIQAATRSYHDPGTFVALLGYEWTSWIHGHRHVLYFGDEGEVYSSVDPDYETPAQLWEALAGQDALTFAHHSAGGPVATNWTYVPDPVLEPVTEVISVHGSSEATDSPARIYSPVPGNFVRDVLDRGLQFGFIGSGDSHDGHPGLAQLASPQGGLAGVFAADRTRGAVLDALRARRTYATSGARIVLRASLGGHRMGSTIDVDAPWSTTLRLRAAGTEPIEYVELIRSDEPIGRLEIGGRLDVDLEIDVEELEEGDYLYLRIKQEDGALAWSSPFYLE